MRDHAACMRLGVHAIGCIVGDAMRLPLHPPCIVLAALVCTGCLELGLAVDGDSDLVELAGEPDVLDVRDANDPGQDEAPSYWGVGDPCENDDQCPGLPGWTRTCLDSTIGSLHFPGGYCSSDCSEYPDCGPGAVCVEDPPRFSLCFRSCLSNWDCRWSDGYECIGLPGITGKYCLVYY
jgi:hypothetical protein